MAMTPAPDLEFGFFTMRNLGQLESFISSKHFCYLLRVISPICSYMDYAVRFKDSRRKIYKL